MSESQDNSIIYIIEDGSTVCMSMHAMLEATNYDVRSVSNAEIFSRKIVESGVIRQKDIILIDLDSNLPSTFRLVNRMMETPDCPGFILLSDDNGSFLPSDQFLHPRLELLQLPISPQSLLAGVEAVL